MALVAVREHRADVAEPGGAEDRVGDRVQQYVSVGMTEQAALERNLDATDHQSATRHQCMDVEPLPHAKGDRHSRPCSPRICPAYRLRCW